MHLRLRLASIDLEEKSGDFWYRWAEILTLCRSRPLSEQSGLTGIQQSSRQISKQETEIFSGIVADGIQFGCGVMPHKGVSL